MRLNDLHPDAGRRHAKRVGRGPGSGTGKTAGRGHKGQKSRSGGFHKTGFEGGQMPLQRRVPKRGFRSTQTTSAELRLDALNRLEGEIDLAALKHAGLVAQRIERVKVINSGELKHKVVLKGITATAGAAKAVADAGGSVESD